MSAVLKTQKHSHVWHRPLVLWLATLLSACAGNGKLDDPPSSRDPATDSVVRVVPLEPLPPEPPSPQAVAALESHEAGKGADDISANRVYRVQLASHQEKQRAAQILDEVRESFETLLQDLRADIQRADLDQKGTWYRVLVGEFRSFERARKLCVEFQDQSQDCIVLDVSD